EGYTFNGWNPAVPQAMPAGDMTCVAQWQINRYTISFDSQGGSEVDSITQDYDTAVVAPADPSKEGYTFNGWNPAVPQTMPAGDTICVAQWTANPYTVNFDANGGTSSLSEQTYSFGVAFADLPTASRPDYSFSGWWTSPDGGTQITGDTIVPVLAPGYTLYAHWELLPDHYITTISLHAGWNLIHAKLNFTETSQKKLREKRAMTLSKKGNFYVFCEQLSPPEACWVFAPADEAITLIGTSPENVDFEASLRSGWNFVAPLEDWSLIGSKAVIAWEWDGHFFYPTDSLRGGFGYFLYWLGD
ncbi:MAG: InlB B-repeat-containing protein, partial [Lentisphaerae bacterium]|nr:InlB B-repeat-containing protein [Lentisphaerota bacterium]